MIPQSDPKRSFDAAQEDIQRAIQRVFERGLFILGPEAEAFEAEFATFLDVRHAVGVSSGTDAVALALSAAGLKPGDEVITVSMTAVATAVAIEDAGGIPKFVDVDPATRCMDPRALAAAIGPRTAAVVPVHLHGFPTPMESIIAVARRYGLLIVEDCAQAHGAIYQGRRVGSFGHAAAFSFYPTKNLGAPGDAGAVVTDDPAIAQRVRRMRLYGWNDERNTVGPGSNRRIDELHAAVLRVLLPRLEAGNAERRSLAHQYRSRLHDLDLELPPHVDGAVYHQFAIAVEGRTALQAFMAARGVQTAVHYPVGAHQQKRFACGASALPVTERLSARLLSLPVQPEVARDHLPEICRVLAEGLRCNRS
ncbi:MAG: DegT/DnrJ/EryC1/StrS family aminotransferase [Proteobacteria bacterium]|nr:DegT/DnrJ/EryC1/StrS family aminotransferase [Burkholderiales bacterium]